ncbi:MAG: carnitine dehydratase [Panacagrimonas sp.]|jgi:alpha-methylacyl-CoA racemase|nr:CaiB/BaiF CoA-transferase family protein [Panacagrimonas sp.]MCC2655182.1 carnitine dehydratase [Panacagrimonas sp.]
MQTNEAKGPLAGIKVVEIESIGPGPFCAMLLADLGANVLTVGRAGKVDPNSDVPVITRNRAGRVGLDMKSAEGRDKVLELVSKADALIEGFRPGVMERLGVGPDDCLKANPRLVYGRMTGWGQDGPMASMAGHDINYIALSGALHSIGTKFSGPVPPLNLVGDFGGGGVMQAFGVVCALLEVRNSGKGQVVDTSMVDGSGALMAMLYGLKASRRWPARRAGNFLDGSAWYYRCYETADGQWMAVGAIEPQFRRLFLEGIGVGEQHDAICSRGDQDEEVHREIEAIFRSQDRAFWAKRFAGSDACVAPVLAMDEVASDPHNIARKTFQTIDGVLQPMPAPRFSRTAAPTPVTGHSAARIAEWGL